MASRTVTFYSKSALTTPAECLPPDWRRYLSNFSLGAGAFQVDVTCISGNPACRGTWTFPTPEHAFQAMKYTHTVKPCDLALVRAFTDPALQAVDARRMGGRKAMKKRAVQLNVSVWNKSRDAAMQCILQARYDHDQAFKAILHEAVVVQGIYLQHVERGRAKQLYWGGESNKLGHMLMELARKHDH